jgi:hypothetical protein
MKPLPHADGSPMDQEQLLSAMGRHFRLTLDSELWRSAAILAGLRMAVNDPIRSQRRDRGEQKNWLADIWGVVGELIAIRALDEVWSGGLRHQPIDFDGAVDEVDIVVDLPAGSLRLEAKAHLLEPKKSWFMINQTAHERSLKRGAMAYMPVLSALGAGRALVGSPISVEDVGGWPEPPKALRLRDPAFGMPLQRLTQRYAGMSVGQAEQLIGRKPMVDPQTLRQAATEAVLDLPSWREHLPPLGRLHARELVEAVLAAETRVRRDR